MKHSPRRFNNVVEHHYCAFLLAPWTLLTVGALCDRGEESLRKARVTTKSATVRALVTLVKNTVKKDQAISRSDKHLIYQDLYIGLSVWEGEDS